MKAKSKRTIRPYLYLSPAWLVIGVVVLIPIIYTLAISLTNMNIWHWTNYSFIGIKNYIKAFTNMRTGFLSALFNTILWTFLNLFLQIILALFISLMLNTEGLRGKGLYKTLMMFSWAMPSYISALIWKHGMFQNDFGFLNQLLRMLGFKGIGWLNSDIPAFISCMIVNLWMSLPYMILVFYGGLQGIDKIYYESAEMEGASRRDKLHFITVPLLKPIVMPAIILTAFITFKQFDIIYLMTMQIGAKTGANIHTVITYAYENAFITNNYGYSSALSVLIFLIIVLLTVINQRNLKKED
ncbi:carbohydrate ABC transporter permease [Anaerocolumna sp. MB42-C2]|uniref:carbohydrate ABC transporter permease n=1 Tax=Anaerocolumna sp. MB42-C2 TaxID=3070997 RepID=UPI0027E1D441|nr:sugar ABC transporter permease [Anaerocolumna sp. MB42-C2]WMJ87174.1 sugar ABC transporter permease [Anaerocolumna sp. MB42-C2]